MLATAMGGKWIAGISPQDWTCDVARRSLAARLAAVQHFLPLAAKKCEEDGEAVHLLRVSTRRAAAALNLYADLLPRRRTSRLVALLKRIRREAGKARDLDVMTHRLKEEYPEAKKKRLLRHLREKRGKAQHRLILLYKQFGHSGLLKRRVGELLTRVFPRGKTARLPEANCFDCWARMQLLPLVTKFFQGSQALAPDIESLHQLRIRCKELRYVMELLAGAFSDSFRDRLYRVVEALQGKLGTINDHAVAFQMLQERLESARRLGERKRLQILLEREESDLEEACRRFRDWWTPTCQRELRVGFEEELNSPALPASPCPRSQVVEASGYHLGCPAEERSRHEDPPSLPTGSPEQLAQLC